jgi:hypothetical protein
MAIHNIFTQVLLPYQLHAIDEDTVVNTFVHSIDGVDAEDASFNVETHLLNFYNSVFPGAGRISQYMHRGLRRAADECFFRHFELANLDGTPPSMFPIIERTWTLGSALNFVENMPSQVAACISFHGDTVGIPERSGSTRPAARRRGRVYLGPWHTNASADTVGDQISVLSDGFRATLAAAGAYYTDTNPGLLQVWSRADAALYPVIGGFVNSMFDTQRSRQLKSFTRTLFGVP